MSSPETRRIRFSVLAALAAVKSSRPARAAATAVTPVIPMVQMPGMRGISPAQVANLPNRGAMFFALALFVTTALLRSAGDGYVALVHATSRHLTRLAGAREDDIELGLPRETDWGAYSESMIGPLEKKKKSKGKAEIFRDYRVDPRTLLFERVEGRAEGK